MQPRTPQAGVIPWRVGPEGLEILLVTSRTTGGWVVPKGSIEPELGPAESAVREGWEEAGVRGELFEQVVGRFRYAKYGRRYVVALYPLRVTEVLEEWPEMGARERAWRTQAEAIAAVENSDLARALTAFAP
jgi:8-oxo-dGTP pyrophosphatase MutT (NUDIX family)